MSPEKVSTNPSISKDVSKAATIPLQDLLELARFWKPAGVLAFHIPLVYGALLSEVNEPQSVNSQHFLTINGWLLLSSFFQRAAACAWNDAADYKFDKQVARTRNRPIPRGSISSAAARLWAATLTLLWMRCVYATESRAAMWTLIPNFAFNMAYPYMKRVTDWPQIFLGFTFSCNVLTGYMMMTQSAWELVIVDPMIFKSLAWTVLAQVAFTCFYDTIYAYQDYEDDKAAGVRSMALRLGNDLNGKISIAIMAVMQVSFLAMIGSAIKVGGAYFLLTCGGSALLATIALASCNLKDPDDCGSWFKKCLVYGGVIQCGGLLADCLRKG
ncbi:MAG: hypothetical protein GOMPHAMPRED_002873 [Gomphillus americanus]|uniref:Uncharacterized protein n=1 Tax=Gomphillus americanus TaxID=1940652 RepID=A0A8H3I8T1_9LECA|nr:MAG: hypothetical protein GOMPHAMPRED_002873 [Gomphillus americanus]